MSGEKSERTGTKSWQVGNVVTKWESSGRMGTQVSKRSVRVRGKVGEWGKEWASGERRETVVKRVDHSILDSRIGWCW